MTTCSESLCEAERPVLEPATYWLHRTPLPLRHHATQHSSDTKVSQFREKLTHTLFALPVAVGASCIGQNDRKFTRLSHEAHSEVQRICGQLDERHDDGSVQRYSLDGTVVELDVERQAELQLLTVVRLHQFRAIRRRTFEKLE